MSNSTNKFPLLRKITRSSCVAISLACLALSAAMMPMTVEAESVTFTIKNKNCRKLVGLKMKQYTRFRVAVSASDEGNKCSSSKKIKVHVGESKKFQVNSGKDCKYHVFATGTWVTAGWTVPAWPADKNRVIKCHEDLVNACVCP